MNKRWARIKRDCNTGKAAAAGTPIADSPFFRVAQVIILFLFSSGWVATIHAQSVTPPSTASNSIKTTKELAIERAQERIRYGLNLGSRRAICSAQVEFLQAARLIAQELDTASGTHEHEEALSAGWKALDTLEYAKSADSAMQKPSLPNSPAVQASPAANDVSSGRAAAFQAMQRQLSYAQERLAFSGGHEPTVSMALYALGRSHVAMAEESPEEGPLCIPKALALYQAALDVDPKNYLAINELGVLFVRCGQLNNALQVLEQGVKLAPQPQMWHNLAKLHEKLGNAALAQEDLRQRDALLAVRQVPLKDSPATALAAVNWVEPAEFARRSGSEDFEQSSKKDAVTPSPQKTTADEPAQTKNTHSWIPNWIGGESKKTSAEPTGG
jgi:hypothetical protein